MANSDMSTFGSTADALAAVSGRQSSSLNRLNMLTGAAGAFSAVGSLVSGYSAYQTAVGRAAIYSTNANMLRAAVPQEQEVASQNVNAIQQDTARLIAGQRAALAANGIIVDQDTGLDALVQAAGAGARDVVVALNNSQTRIAKLRAEAAQAEMEAAASKRQGTAGLFEGIGKAGLSILSTASSISQNNTRYKTGG